VSDYPVGSPRGCGCVCLVAAIGLVFALVVGLVVYLWRHIAWVP